MQKCDRKATEGPQLEDDSHTTKLSDHMAPQATQASSSHSGAAQSEDAQPALVASHQRQQQAGSKRYSNSVSGDIEQEIKGERRKRPYKSASKAVEHSIKQTAEAPAAIADPLLRAARHAELHIFHGKASRPSLPTAVLRQAKIAKQRRAPDAVGRPSYYASRHVLSHSHSMSGEEVRSAVADPQPDEQQQHEGYQPEPAASVACQTRGQQPADKASGRRGKDCPFIDQSLSADECFHGLREKLRERFCRISGFDANAWGSHDLVRASIQEVVRRLDTCTAIGVDKRAEQRNRSQSLCEDDLPHTVPSQSALDAFPCIPSIDWQALDKKGPIAEDFAGSFLSETPKEGGQAAGLLLSRKLPAAPLINAEFQCHGPSSETKSNPMPSTPSMSLTWSESSDSGSDGFDISPMSVRAQDHVSGGLPSFASCLQDDNDPLDINTTVDACADQPDGSRTDAVLPTFLVKGADAGGLSADGGAQALFRRSDPVQEFAEFCASLEEQPSHVNP